jgi:hypothetical protein
MYCYKLLVNFEIQAAKYLQILATSKTQSTTRNVYFTIPATFCKGCMGCRDYKNMHLSARTADYVNLRSLVIDCGAYMLSQKLYGPIMTLWSASSLATYRTNVEQ